MRALGKLEMKRLMEWPEDEPGHEEAIAALNWADTQRLMKEWSAREKKDVVPVMEELVNCKDRDLGRFRELCPPQYDIANFSDYELAHLRDQLQVVWLAAENKEQGIKDKDKETPRQILNEWWRAYPLENGPFWVLFYQIGAFVPTEQNFRAMAADVCVHSRLLGKCSECGRFYVKYRPKQKICMGEDCARSSTRQRVKAHYDRTHKARKGKKRS